MKVSNEQPTEIRRVKMKRKKRFISREKKEACLREGGNVLEKAKALDQMSIGSNNLKSQFVDLEPLREVFILGLKTKGITPSKDLAVLSQQFYNEVVRNSFKTGATKFKSEFKEQDILNIPIDTVDAAKEAIVAGILSFIKNVKSKKDAGQTLSKVEENVYNGTSIVEANLKKAAKEEASKTLGEKILFDPNIRLILGFVLVIIVYVVFFKK
jgi:hypothetical protein